MEEGKLIVLVGGDGSGTTTCMEQLQKTLPEDVFVFTREPGGTELGELLRDVVKNNELNVYEQILAFELIRSLHFRQMVLPALSDGKHVICDRCSESTYAYQIYALGSRYGLKQIFFELDKRSRQHRDIDLWINFDIDPEIALSRRKAVGVGTDVFDSKSLEYHTRVRDGLDYFLLQANNDPTDPFFGSIQGDIMTVDATLPKDALAEEVYRVITEFVT